MDDIYTGRVICLITDAHGMDVPVVAALKDAEKNGATMFISLGDNLGVRSKEVMDAFNQYNVKSIAGNAEEYIRIGLGPFNYIYGSRIRTEEWVKNQLSENQIGEIQLYPSFIDLVVGGKKIALCHFANDVRFDFGFNSTWSYQSNIENRDSGYQQFLYTNSKEQIEYMKRMKEKYGVDNEQMRGILSAIDKPLFDGKTVDMYDAIFQGHVHFRITEETDKTKFYTVRAVGMAYKYNNCINPLRNYNEPRDMASYVLIREKKNNQGFGVEEHLVKFDWDKMAYEVLTSDMPGNKLGLFMGITKEDEERIKNR